MQTSVDWICKFERSERLSNFHLRIRSTMTKWASRLQKVNYSFFVLIFYHLGVILYGPPGTGKTLLVSLMLF
jgi:SpoVK/Ycf46/Vps4 family AAA+-type ATPase